MTASTGLAGGRWSPRPLADGGSASGPAPTANPVKRQPLFDDIARQPKSVVRRRAREYNTRVDNPDWDDIQASLASDDAAFARLVERYQSPVARLMWRFSRDPGRCEELTQDVFVEAYQSLRTYRGDAPFLHWLRRIGTRVGYRFWRRRARDARRVPLEDIEGIAEQTDAVDPAVAGEVLDALLAQLRPDDRLVLTLEYLEQCTMKEIAERTGWTEDAAKMRAHRARTKLRDIAERTHLLEALGWTS